VGGLRESVVQLVGDAVALSSVTPFLLEFVLPPVRRFLGAKHAIAAARDDRALCSGKAAQEFGFKQPRQVVQMNLRAYPG